MRQFNYLLIGNSAAAISAAEAIRSVDATGSIAIVDRENTPAYSTPMISYLLKGKIGVDELQIRPDSFYDDNHIMLISGHEVCKLDPNSHTIQTDKEAVSYRKLLIACGSKPSPTPLEGLEGPNVFGFLNLTNAKAILEYVDRLRASGKSKISAVAIGSGLIGCKACEGLSGIADSVTMLARSPQILRSVLDGSASPMAESALQSGGVDVRLATTAVGFSKNPESGAIESLSLSDGTQIECDIAIMAAGVVPNSGFAQDAGISVAKSGAILTDEHMRTNLKDVYAAGDVTISRNFIDGTEKVIALWPNAVAQGKVAGASMAASLTGIPAQTAFDHAFPLNSITLFGTTILSAGVKDAGDGMSERIDAEPTTFRKFVVKDDRLVGFSLVNMPQNAGIYTRMIDEQIPISSVNQQIFDRTPELMDLPDSIRWGAEVLIDKKECLA